MTERRKTISQLAPIWSQYTELKECRLKALSSWAQLQHDTNLMGRENRRLFDK